MFDHMAQSESMLGRSQGYRVGKGIGEKLQMTRSDRAMRSASMAILRQKKKK